MDDLEEFYRQRNLLKTRVVAEDVAEAALFFASQRSSKCTGDASGRWRSARSIPALIRSPRGAQ